MRILMLGWEFPPHISGGLGTACLGITRGLAPHGVHVTLVLPKAFGDEQPGPARILGCSTYDLDSPTGPASHALVRLLGVDSALSPYLDEESYRARRQSLSRTEVPSDDPAKRKLRVVHNAVSPSETPRLPPPARVTPEPVVLFLGRVTYQKGPAYFLEAAARGVRALPNVRFVVAGNGDLLPSIVERTASLGLARHVRFTGFLSGTDVERMYRKADVYVMPSVTEPFGIAPLEAMAFGVPVIVSRTSGVSEVLTSAPTS